MMDALIPGWSDVAAITIAFALGGFVKGVIGVALPLLAMAILTFTFSVPAAVTLVTLPTLVANLYQGLQPAEIGPAFRRFWPLLLALVPGIVIGTGFLASLSTRALLGLVGTAILIAVIVQLAHPDRPIPRRIERWSAPAVGLIAGILGGVAGLFGPPMGVYMAGLRLSKDTFIASISLANATACVPLAILLYLRGIAEPAMIAGSIGALVPMFAGMMMGQRVRRRIDTRTFHRLVQIALVVAGLNFLRGALG